MLQRLAAGVRRRLARNPAISQFSGLDVAFNEATLVAVEMDVPSRRFAATLAVLSLPPDGDEPPKDPRISVLVEPVGRLAVSWRLGHWSDKRLKAHPLDVADLSSTVRSFGSLPIYGWKFLDAVGNSWTHSKSRLSLDLRLGSERSHTLDLFQEQHDGYIALRVWFERLTISRIVGGKLTTVSIDEVAADGQRWWDALAAQDPRTASSGLFSLKGKSIEDASRDIGDKVTEALERGD